MVSQTPSRLFDPDMRPIGLTPLVRRRHLAAPGGGFFRALSAVSASALMNAVIA